MFLFSFVLFIVFFETPRLRSQKQIMRLHFAGRAPAGRDRAPAGRRGRPAGVGLAPPERARGRARGERAVACAGT